MKIILLFLAVLFESHGLPTSLNSDNNLVFNATRNVKREAEENIKQAPGANSRASNIKIIDRYPSGRSGTTPNIILKPGRQFNFNCSSTEEWFLCMWKSPLADDPCIITKRKTVDQCGIGFGDFSIRRVQNGNLRTCSISGTLDPSLNLEGLWNCDFQANEDKSPKYVDAQEFFALELVKQPTIRFSHTSSSGSISQNGEQQFYETDEIEFTCEASNGYPAPELVWFINDVQIDFRRDEQFSIVHTDGPRESSAKRYYIQQTIRYKAGIKENGKKISCRGRQIDDESNISEEYNEKNSFYLYISPQPVDRTEPISTQMIAGIVSIIVLILLVIFVVGFLFYTKRFCFATPIVTIAPSESKETGEMIIQTDPANGKLISGGVSTETEPLLGQALQTQTDLGDTEPDIGKQKECDYSVDQTKEYCYEGNGSLAGSLSSIQSEPESIDLEAEFRALGRPFKKLAELYTDADDDIVVSDSSSDDSSLDSFKIVDESTANNSEVEV